MARGAGLLLGYAADTWWGDPRRFHPVAGFGRAARVAERSAYADSRSHGVAYAGLLVGAVTATGVVAHRAARASALGEVLVTAAATWTVLGGRSLLREAEAMGALLAGPDVEAARARLSHLCSRDASELGADALARATTESVAENTSDAVVAPLLWGALAGVPGLLGYRAVNTLDAMVGYRSPRYARFGWAAAKLDDLANWVPARVAAAFTVLAAGSVAGESRHALAVWRRDASAHPSPNAGQVEAAFAGALGVRLGGASVYGGRPEDRAVMDGGRDVRLSDLTRAARLSRVVGAVTAGSVGALLIGTALAGRRDGGL